MLKEGETVIVRGTKDLNTMRLDKLNRKRGVVDKVVYSDGRPIAAYVKFKKHRTTSKVLVPIGSLEGVSTVHHIRTLNILKNTKI